MPRVSLATSLAAALVLASACGPAPTPPTTPEPPAPVAQTAPAPPPAPPAAIRAGAMPSDVQVYAEVTGARELLEKTGGAVGTASAEARKALGRALGLDAAQVDRLAAALVSIHAGGRKAGGDLKLATSIVFADAQPVRDLVAAGVLVEQGAFGVHGRKVSPRDAKDGPVLVWFEAVKLLVAGDEPMLESIAAVVEGKDPGLGEAQLKSALPPAEGRNVRAFVTPALLEDLTHNRVSFPAPLSLAYGAFEGGFRGSLRAAIAAQGLQASIPLVPARTLALARRLPAETAGYVALSTALPGGKSGASQLLAQLASAGGARGLEGIDSVLEGAGLRLADVLGAFGGEGVIGVALKPGAATEEDLLHGFAAVYLQELSDARPAEHLLKLAREKLAGPPLKAKVHAESGGFTAEIARGPVPFVRARVLGGKVLFVALGQRDLVTRAATAAEKGTGTLGGEAVHARALAAMPENAQVRLWVDLGRVAEIAAARAPAEQRAALDLWRGVATGPNRISTGLSFIAVPESDRVRLELDEVNGIGVFAALGIYGVRRYLARAKVAEAKNALGAISRAAVAAWERESLAPGSGGGTVHALCKSSISVPSRIPAGKKYQSSTRDGEDYNTGDDTTGWRCLKFAMVEPQYYRYTYTVGGPYKGPARGGPDPGPNGFEVAAEGDLDGNGVTSLFTRIGIVDPGGFVKISSELFIDKELE